MKRRPRKACLPWRRSRLEIYAYAPWGYQGDLVRVEVDLRRGIPGMEIVGLPGHAVREARERIRIALRRAGFAFPAERILINLSPADLPKTGSGYDLPMALALLQASGQWVGPAGRLLALGELGLDGALRRVPGVLAAAQNCLSAGLDGMAVAAEALAEATCATGLPLAAGPDLASLVNQLRQPLQALPRPVAEPDDDGGAARPDSDLRGNPASLQALEVAAAGGHSLLFYGPPGAGKSLAGRSLQALLPPLEADEALETTRLWSLAGILPRRQGLLRERPFRAPHHHATAEGLLGGGRLLGPGEISLAHHGVLFLDEAPEFSSRVLQSLREPLEQGQVAVVRAGRSAWFPARFALVLTANACPCGQTGRERGVCFCSAHEIRRYWDRLGSALLDRVELRVFQRPEDPSALLVQPAADLALLRQRIAAARRRQRERGQGPGQSNASLGPADLDRWAAPDRAGLTVLAQAVRARGWSSRALHSLLRVARTHADLAGRDAVGAADLEAAVALRQPDGEEYWER